MASGNIYWRNLDQSTYNGDLNDEFVMMMPLKRRMYWQRNENEGVITDPQQIQNAYGVNGQLTFDDDLFDRRNQFIVGAAFEYSKVKFNSLNKKLQHLILWFFSGEQRRSRAKYWITGKTYTSSIFATNNHAINDQWSINNSLRYNYVDIRNTDTLNWDGGATHLLVTMTLIA